MCRNLAAWCGLIMALGLGGVVPSGHAQPLQAQPLQAQPPPEEYDFKARFVYQFCNFVDWPKDLKLGGKTFLIGVVGRDPFGKHLERFAGAAVDDKKIVIERFPAAKDVKPCHVLFVAADADLPAVLAKTRNQPVLLVSDRSGWAEKGTMINMYLDEQKRVRFEINHEAAKRAQLNIRANLLKLARLVKDAPEAP